MVALNTRQSGPVSGPAIVLLHGFIGAAEDWEPVIRELPGRRVLAIDLPGHGASLGLPPKAYTLEGTARLVENAIPGDGSCLICGYSMGGRVALHLPNAPSRSFCLVGSHPGIRDPEARAERLAKDRALANRIETDFPAVLAAWLRMPLFESLNDDSRREIEQRRLERSRPEEIARALRGLSTGHQSSHWERRMDPTVTWLAGEADQRYLDIYQNEPGPIVMVPGAGHNVPAEQPKLLAGILDGRMETR
ncbi:MAG: alpha/beta fold hydrolase [Rhodothermales bacterium]|nr:alpha/beta fold hydrolase [Rhodothermales bacterium]